MKKLIKFVFGLAVVFFAIIIAAVVILPMVISPNDYKPQIVEAVKQQTGRDLSIDGEIGLNVFPKIGLTLGKTELSNAAGFQQKLFARVEGINIQVALMPLLDKKVEMDEIVLQGLVLNLHRNKQGVTNWDDLVQDKPKKKKKSDMPELAALAIGGLRVEAAEVHWMDELNGQQYDIQNFNLISGPLIAGDPVELKLDTDFASGQPSLQGKLGLATTVQVDVDQSRFIFSAPKLNISAAGEVLPGGKATAELQAKQTELDLKTQTLVVDGLVFNILNLTVNGGLSGKAILSDVPQLTGRLQLQTFNARELMTALGQPALQTADATVLTRVGAGFDLAASSKQAKLSNLEVRLDDTVMKGHLGVSQFASPAITFDLDIDKIDLDRYLPAEAVTSPGAVAQGAAPPAKAAEPELFPVQALKQLNANGEARIGEIIKSKVRASNVVIKLKAKDGQVNVKPSAKLYKGSYDADVNINVKPAVPRLTVDANLLGVQIEPLLKDMQGKAKLAGKTDAIVTINATGNTQTALKQTLNGNASFSFENGALVGVNIAKVIREGWAKVSGKPVPATGEPDKTDFSELKGTAKITNGVVDNQDFSMKSPLLRITGAGKANLVGEQLDYLLKVAIVGSLQGQGGDDLTKLKGVTIPVRITGTFDKPSYKPDLSAALSDTVKAKAKEKVEEKKDAVKQKLQDKLKSKFKGLF